jgi:hypothetical protein
VRRSKMAVLLVGLGGTGGEVLKRVKKQMEDSPYSGDVVYYYVDSRADAGEGFGPGEFRHVGGFRVSTKVKEHKAAIKDWWYTTTPYFKKNYQPAYDTTDGAGQTRLIGRLCYYLWGESIQQDINRILRQRLMGNRLDVIVVGSSAGGTGSSLFCDFGFLLKKCIGNQKKAKYFGVVLDASVVRDRISPDDRGKIKSEINGLAFLTELEYYMANPEKYSFEFFSRGAVEEVKGDEKPYDSVVLVQLENMAGYSFNEKDDYFHLQADGLWHLINISFRELGGQVGGTGIENYFNDLWISETINDKTQHYASFGCATIKFPFEKVQSYCEIRYTRKVLSKLLQALNAEEVIKVKDTVKRQILHWGIKESDDNDQLIKMARRILEEINSYWKINSDELRKSLVRKLLNSREGFGSVLENDEKKLKEDLNTLSKKKIKNKLKTIEEEIWKWIEEQLNMSYKEGHWKEAHRLLLDLKSSVKNEKLDVLENEDKGWLKKRRYDSIKQELIRLTNPIKGDYTRSILYKILRKGTWKQEIEAKKKKLARKWVEELFTFLLLEKIVPIIDDFYSALITKLEKTERELGVLLDSFEDYNNALDSTGLLNTSVDKPGHKMGGIDYEFEVCSSDEIVDDMIFNKFDEKEVMDDIKKITEKRTLKNLQKIVAEKTRTLLEPIKIDEAFKLEAEYFWKTRNVNLKDTFQRGMYDEQESIINNLQDVFGLQVLRDIRTYVKQHTRGTRFTGKESKIIEMLITGRMRLLLDWGAPLWQWAPQMEGIKDPFKFSVYHLNEENEVVNKILDRLNPDIAENAKTTGYQMTNPYQVLFFQLQGIQPLFNLQAVAELREREEERRTLFRSKKEASEIQSPDQVGYFDRKFVVDTPYIHADCFPPYKEERIFVTFALAEILSYIQTKSEKARKNFELTITLGIKGGRRKQVLGTSIVDSLQYLEGHEKVLQALGEKCKAEFDKRKVRDLNTLSSCIKSIWELYDSYRKKYSGKIGKVYENLCEHLEGFLQENDVEIDI